VIEDGEIEHIAVIPMGGMHVTNDLAIGLKTDLDIAEDVKIKYANLNPSAAGETSFVKDGKTHHFDKEMMRVIVEARMAEILEYADKELKKIRRSRKLPGGAVLVGGGSKLPGLAEFAREELQLPARLGKWDHVKRVVDGLDEQQFSGAVGLMLLDMFLGPAQHGSFGESHPGLLASAGFSMGGVLGRFKRRK
jgi:cell division protein FtsA